MGLKVALYNPISLRSGPHKKTSPSLALIGIAHEARKLGAEVLIVEEDRTIHTRALNALRTFNPDIVGISTYFHQDCISYGQDVIREMRGKAKIAIGGHDASVRPKELVGIFKPDYVFVDEGEISFAQMISAGFDLARADPAVVTINLVDGVPVIVSKIPYPLDELPLPTEMPPTFPETQRYDEAAINIARGCIGKCTFCGGARKQLSYMTPSRVLAHIHAWLSIRNRYIDLMAPDFTSHHRKANEIIDAINTKLGVPGLSYFLSVRLDSMGRALDLSLESWKRFFGENHVKVEVGYETKIARRLGREHFAKTDDPTSHYDNLVRLLEMGVEVAVDLISFDPKTTLEEATEDYFALLELAKKYPKMTIYPDAIFRELNIYPGTRAVEIFGTPDYRLKGYRDRRLRVLIDTLRYNRSFFGTSEYLPLATTLRRICVLIHFIRKNSRSATEPVSQSSIDSFIEHLEEHPENVKYHLPQ